MKNLSNVDTNHEASTMLQHGDPLTCARFVLSFGLRAESSDLLNKPGNHRIKTRNKKPPSLSNCKQDRNFSLADDEIFAR